MSSEGSEADEHGLADFEPGPQPDISTMPASAAGVPDPRIIGGPAPAQATPHPGIVGGPTPAGDTPGLGMHTMQAAAPASGGHSSPTWGLGTAHVEDPDQLRKAGTGARALAGDLKAKGERGAGALGMASQTFIGTRNPELSKALVKAHDRWEQQVSELRKLSLQVASNCITTADNLTTTETANSETMKSLSDFD